MTYVDTDFDQLGAEIHQWARDQGFYDREFVASERNPSLPAEKLMLVVSECAEVLDALRDDDRDHEGEEVADILIRVLDYAAWRGVNLNRLVYEKMAVNRLRPTLHGRKAF